MFDIRDDDPAGWHQETIIAAGTNPQSILAVSNEAHVLCTGYPAENDGGVYVIEGSAFIRQYDVGGSP